MAQSQNRHSIIVGIFIFCGLAALSLGVMVVADKRNTFQKSITLHAIFNDVRGLQKGSNIWFSGVKVGSVKGLSFLPNGKVKVEMKISQRTQGFIFKNSKVRIGTDGLIGNTIIEIYDGSPGLGPVSKNQTLIADVRPTSYEMMNTLQESNKNLAVISGRLARGEGTLGNLLTSDTLARQLQMTATKLNTAATDVQLLMTNLANYSARMQNKGSLANELVTDTTLFSTLKASARQIKQASSNMAGFSAQLQNKGTLANELATDTILFSALKASAAQIKQASANASEITNNLKKFSTTLKDSAGIAGVLLHDTAAASNLKATFENLQAGTHKFDENMEAIQHNFLFRRFFKKKAQLRRQQQEQQRLTCPKPPQYSAN